MKIMAIQFNPALGSPTFSQRHWQTNNMTASLSSF
jgi:hypothetical protein